jgi:hypothetical protein
MNFIKKGLVSGFDSLLTRLLVKKFGILESGEEPKSECPELELLAAYLEHNLTASQVKEVEGHLVECRLCRETVVGVFKSQKLLADPAWQEMEKS